MRVREETEADHAAVHELHVAAFGGPAEAKLVEVLRVRAAPVVSLVAEDAGAVVGHVLFTPVTVAGHPEAIEDGVSGFLVEPDHPAALADALAALLGDPPRRAQLGRAGRAAVLERFTADTMARGVADALETICPAPTA